jgi:hypothetical protein
MKIRKSLIGIGAALMMVGASAYAEDPPPKAYVDCGNRMDPDPALITTSLINLADYLRKDTPETADFGPWPYKPIWQKRGTGSYEVHDSLARKLYEKREFGDGKKPPQKKNNDAAGAAWDIENGKYDAAVDKLLSFNKDVSKSRENIWDKDHAMPDFQNSMDAEDHFVTEVTIALHCVCKLTECNF